MRVRVVLEVAYVVRVGRSAGAALIDPADAVRAVEANWDSVYKYQAVCEDFPPTLSGRILRIEPVKEGGAS